MSSIYKLQVLFTFLFFSIASTTVLSAQEYAHQIIIGGEEVPQSYSLVARSPAPIPPSFAPLMGKWESVFDTEEIILFKPGSYTTYYEGIKVVEETMNYFEQCPSDCYPAASSSAKTCFKLADQCFVILLVDEDELHIGVAGMAEGDGLVYKRVVE